MADRPSSPDDIVSLEDLVRDTSAPPIADAVSNIDKVLEVEDPSFAAELNELRAEGASAAADASVSVDTDVDSILAQEKKEKAARGWRQIKLWLLIKPRRRFLRALLSLRAVWPWIVMTVWPAINSVAISSAQGLKTSALYLLGKAKAGFAWFVKLSAPSKLLLIMVIGFSVAAVMVVRVAWRGSYLPNLQRNFLVSFAPVADQSFKIEKDEAWEDLNDPLLHPEHIVLIERLIVNLRSPGDGSNPMGMVDLFVEASSQAAAVELKDREAEMRDMILRTMEQMTFDELSTEAGKTKLKVFLRKNLNDSLSRGRVRRVFYKSIVISP